MDKNAEAREHLLALFHAGLAAVQADQCLPQRLPRTPAKGRNVLFALGKAAGHMARVAYQHMDIDEALIITRHGHMPTEWRVPDSARVIEAGHPNPDEASVEAGLAAEALVTPLGEDDRLMALISGGGSALMTAPVAGISFAEKKALNQRLLASGAPIGDINRVRAALSRLKGGGLAALARPAEVLTYAISDVPGDNPTYVASGPTCQLPDGESAAAIIARHCIEVTDAIDRSMKDVSNPSLHQNVVVVCGKADDALQAIAVEAASRGYEPVVLGSAIEGDAAQIATDHAALARQYLAQGLRVAIISGGETSVAVTNPDGAGGRNLTYALAFAAAVDGLSGIAVMAADSEGIDGTSKVAGAMVFPDTLARARNAGLDPMMAIEKQQSADFFNGVGDTVCSGPSGTNVNDLRVILVDPRAADDCR